MPTGRIVARSGHVGEEATLSSILYNGFGALMQWWET